MFRDAMKSYFPPSCPFDDCVIFPNNSVCKEGDALCEKAMKAAGIEGPYFTPSKPYHWSCLLTLGVLKKPTKMMSEAAATGLGRLFSAAGATAVGDAIPIVWRHPVTFTLFLPKIAEEIFTKCECK